jgi:hypothetical protein
VSKSKRRREANPVRVRKMEAQSNSSSSSVRSPGAVRNKMEKREKKIWERNRSSSVACRTSRAMSFPRVGRVSSSAQHCAFPSSAHGSSRDITARLAPPWLWICGIGQVRPSGRTFIGSHSLPPPLSGRLIAPSIAYRN